MPCFLAVDSPLSCHPWGIFRKSPRRGRPGRDVFPGRFFSLTVELSEGAVAEEGNAAKESLPISLLFWKLH